MSGASLLQVADLSVDIGTGAGSVAALSDVDMEVRRGEIVGLVGESGGGKSMLARAVVGMLPDSATARGTVRLDGEDVLAMTPTQLRTHRGGGAALCFQNPRSALAPTRTVGRQLTDRLEIHQGLTSRAAQQAAVALLEQVGIRDPGRRFGAYPHEMSGGMCQRVMIALALACSPALLLADEPTTGLDVTLTREILGLFRRAADQDGRGVLLISHDLASIGSVCDRIVVLYAGTVVESGPARLLLDRPAHPYTEALVGSVPDLEGLPITATRGTMPLLREPPTSCPFAARCERADDRCHNHRPPLEPYPSGRTAACFHPIGLDPPAASGGMPASSVTDMRIIGGSTAATRPAVQPGSMTGRNETSPDGLALDVRNVSVTFRSRFGSSAFRALHDVSLTVQHGESVGVVGESGCGKSTLARVVTGLQQISAGSVRLRDMELTGSSRRERRELGRRVQMVFQDPQGSLSPRRSALDAVSEPLRVSGLSKAELLGRAERAIAETGLDTSILDRRPSQLSGGQAQRIGIARALIGDPELIVLDEPTSALDVTVQAQILELIKGLAAQRTRSFVFISHDLATVRGFCDRVVVLYLGRLVEQGPAAQIFAAPLHPYTRALLSSAPRLHGTNPLSPVRLSRDLEPAGASPGCPLVLRCPFAVTACQQPQELREYAPGQWAACHRAPEIPQIGSDPSGEPSGEKRSSDQ